jgi:hypothetical protein
MFTFTVKGKLVEAATLAECSAEYSKIREASGLGASRFPGVTIFEGGAAVARLSYNGKVWGPEEWPQAALLYSPYATEGGTT